MTIRNAGNMSWSMKHTICLKIAIAEYELETNWLPVRGGHYQSCDLKDRPATHRLSGLQTKRATVPMKVNGRLTTAPDWLLEGGKLGPTQWEGCP